MEKAKETVFGLSELPDGTKFLMLGMTDAAWATIKSGLTHEFDLTKMGIPVRLVLYGGGSVEDVMQVITAYNEAAGNKTAFDPRDFSIPTPSPETVAEDCLHCVIRELIQARAQQSGIIDFAATVDGLGEVLAELFAGVPNSTIAKQLLITFSDKLETTTRRKRLSGNFPQSTQKSAH